MFAPKSLAGLLAESADRHHLRGGSAVFGESAFVTMNQLYDSFTKKLEELLFPRDSLWFPVDALHSQLIKRSLSRKQTLNPLMAKGHIRE